MLAARPAVREDIGVGAARFLQGVGQDRQQAAVQRAFRHVPLVVGGPGQADHGGVVPGQDGGIEGDRAEGVAEEVAQQAAQGRELGPVLPPV